VGDWWEIGGRLVGDWWEIGGRLVGDWWEIGGRLEGDWGEIGGRDGMSCTFFCNFWDNFFLVQDQLFANSWQLQLELGWCPDRGARVRMSE